MGTGESECVSFFLPVKLHIKITEVCYIFNRY